MMAWTRMLMVSATVALLAPLTACPGDDESDDGDSDGAADAGIDAAPPAPDAAPPSPFGVWALRQVSFGGLVLGNENVDFGGELRRVNGTMTLLDTGEGSQVSVDWLDDRLVGAGGRAAALTVDEANGQLTLGEEMVGYVLDTTGSPVQLTITAAEGSAKLDRLEHTATESITLGGFATIEGGAPALVEPAVTLVSVVKGKGGAQEYRVEDPVGQPMNDFDLPATFGDEASDTDEASFTVGRTEGALGFERIVYGTGGMVTLLLVVGYEDRDGDGKLAQARMVVDDCAAANLDCVRGVAPLMVGYRLGDTPELQASPYDMLLPGWAISVHGVDQRNSMNAVMPLDPSSPVAPTTTLVFKSDPTSVELPIFNF